MRRFITAVAIIWSLVLSACGEEPREQQALAPPPTVTVVAVAQKEVTPSVTFNGHVEAVDTVELRARVEGFVEKRLFDEGAEVKAGDLLIVLEKAPYEAQIGQIKGQITGAEGGLRLAEIEVQRQTTLVQREAVAQQKLDEAEANYKVSLGELQRLRASLQSAELNLSYTDIKAPMDGRIGRFAYSVGDYVTPSSEALAEIVSQDPVYVNFPVSARQLLEVSRLAQEHGGNPRAVKVKLRLPDGSIYAETGTINFVNVAVDRSTDTVTVRSTFANPQRLLIHDELIAVIVDQAQPEQALVIPQAAIAVDQAGPYVLVVNKDSKVEQRRIRPGSPQGADVTVIEGLKEHDNVIIEGLQKVRPGQAVQVSSSAS